MSQQKSDKKLFLIDGHAVAYRAYYALIKNPLTNSRGQPTGAVYGFATYLLKLLDDYKCPYIGVVFDSPEPTFRHKLYKEYKANREEMPDDMKSQIPLIRKLVEAFNITALAQPGLEADDIIAHMTRRARSEGFEVFLVTKDKDLMQLVGPGVRMLAFESAGGIAVVGPDQVKEKLGVLPEQVRDLLALMGDSSDNIPGVPGVGPKTAQKILEKAGTVEKLLKDPSVVENEKLQAKIAENRDMILLSQKLATLHSDVSYDVNVGDLVARPVKKDECIEFFKELEFTSLLKNPLFVQEKKICHASTVPKSAAELEAFVKKIKAAGYVSVDTETTSLVPRQASLVGISLALDDNQAMYVPVGHTGKDASSNLPFPKVLAALKDILESKSVAKIGQNLKYDYQVLKNHGITMRGIAFDTMIAAYVLDPGKRNYGLDAMAAEHLGVSTVPIESLIGKGKKQVCFSEAPVAEAAEYSCEDVILPLHLKKLFEPVLDERKQVALFSDIEMPLVAVLAEMEWEGVRIDDGLLARLSKQYTKDLAAISKDIYRLAGEEFNLNSPKQISAILFDKLKLPKSKKTKTGLSTDVDALEKLEGSHPIIPKLLEYREAQKLLSTYIDALGPQVLPATGRLHTTFNQTIAATGRLSSANPNLQNIPVRTDAGRTIREAFIASEGRVLVSADYSQIELRILAHVSKDPFLAASFMEDKDIHTQTASAIYGVFPEMVTQEMRRAAKTINFGLMYGMGPVNLSRQLGISFKEASEFIETYFKQFPTIKSCMEKNIRKARASGFSETLLGRRRYLPEINAENRQVREAAERTAINTPIQGTAADIIKIAMIRISEAAEESGFDFKMLLQVHDELVFEVKTKDAEAFKEWACKMMSEAYRLNVPIKVEAGVGKNWSEAH
ncbi:MAG TPA: DNA polymerase I [Chitinivibrionales bacterium]|nr:DNA polymerase I [Chitinivibrionales bacterium]